MEINFTTPAAYIWRDSGLFLGASSIPARDIKLTSSQLVVCLDGDIVTTRKDGSQFSSRSFLLKAGSTTKAKSFDSTKAIVAVYYLGSTSQDYQVLQNLTRGKNEDIYYDFEHEDQLIATLSNLRDEPYTAEDAHQLWRNVLIPESMRDLKFREFDERIIMVKKRIQETVDQNMPIKALADEVFLSESRLVKLFKTQIGVPITRYRLGYRLSLGAVYLATGSSVTEAALLSGFASTAHFSKCYVAMMGIQPSTAFLNPPFLRTVIAEEILESLKLRAQVLNQKNLGI